MKAGARENTEELEVYAGDAVARVASFRFFGSGSKVIDGLLGGGYRAGRITEIYGRSSSGKSQLAMQAALVAAKGGAKSLFVDTEGAFRPERLEEIAKARGWKTEGLLERIVYVRTDSFLAQMDTLRMMASRPATSQCKLVVVDTLTRNFSLELPGKPNLSSRQGALDVYLSEMARDAYLNGRAYLLTNRVTFGTTHDIGIGGRTVEQLVHASLRLEREGPRLKAVLAATGESVSASIGAFGVD